MPNISFCCRLVVAFVILGITASHGLAQENQQEHEEHPRHRLGVMIGHTHIPLGFLPNNQSGFLNVPTWGFSYDFRLAERWAIGLHTELETANYIIEHSGSVELERERPFKIVLAGIYNPWKALVFEVGFGRELEKNENFWIYRIGTAYEIEIRNGWDLAPSIFFDFKEDIYTSVTFGLQIGKQF
jgi:hypothetical protein